MKQISEEKLDRVIKEKELKWSFQIKENGIYGIEITASAKSWWQNLLKLSTFLKDDNLTLKIDDIPFPKKSGKRGLFDGEIAWNGNNLKGLKKTNFFIFKLKEGTHDLVFLADQTPKVEIIRIFKIEENEFSYSPKDNYPIKEGNRRQWLTIVLCNFGLNALKIKASAKQGKTFLFFKKDDSDLKLIVNDQIQKNQEPKSHKNWFWCGSTLKGKSKLFEKELNLGPDIHYLEFWTDRNPEMEEITIRIEELKKIPTVDNPKWTGNFKDDTEEILLARLIFGEARNQPLEAKIWIAWSVINRVEAKAWPNTLHEVILQPGQYDPFKSTDSNYSKIIDPLKRTDPQTVQAWRECYEIARVAVNKETENPTSATHFHGKGVTKEWFEKNVVPNGKFLQKIGDTYFYWSLN